MRSPLVVVGRARSLMAKFAAYWRPSQPLDSLAEAAIDDAFAKMADDADYQRDSISLAHEFETSDWQVLQ